ncbi:peroxidasin homolog [Sycon ciliatum]|uniref:peroxidasin homolog n=1 Tax=Sycon ciliatum TaxID=27933 RepID=UPI0031F6A20B
MLCLRVSGIANLALCFLSVISGTIGGDVCTNRTRSAGRLHVTCTHWQNADDIESLCGRLRSPETPVTMVLHDLGSAVERHARLHALSPDVSIAGVGCLHRLRIQSGTFEALNIDFAFGNLTKLSIHNTSLRGMPEILRWQASLRHLNLSHNMIDKLNLSGTARQTMPHLQVLDLSHNRLKVLPADAFRYLISLSILKLDNNLVKTVQHGFLRGLLGLKEVTLRGNNIRWLTRHSLHAGEEATVSINIDLAGNPLETLPLDSMRIFPNMSLVVDSTSLICDCGLRNIRHVLTTVQGFKGVCASPESLRSQTLASVHWDRLQCLSQSVFRSHVPRYVTHQAGTRATLKCALDVSVQSPSLLSNIGVYWVRNSQELPGSRTYLLESPSSARRRRRFAWADLWDDFAEPTHAPGKFTSSIKVDEKQAGRYVSSLTIQNLASDDDDDYKCFSFPEHIESNGVRLRVIEPVSLALIGKDTMKVWPGQEVTLSCKATGVPLPALSWHFRRHGDSREALLTPGSGVKLKGVHSAKNMSIQSTLQVVAGDSGTYRCRSSNRFNSSSVYVQVIVQAVPTITVKLSSHRLLPGEVFVATCLSNMPMNFTWLKYGGSSIGDVPIKASESDSQPLIWNSGRNRSVLLYYKLQDVGSHSFTCQASYGPGAVSQTETVVVTGQPVLSERPGAIQSQTQPSTSPATSPATSPTTTPATSTSTTPTDGPPQEQLSSVTSKYKIPFFISIGVAIAVVLVILVALVLNARREPSQESSEKK